MAGALRFSHSRGAWHWKRGDAVAAEEDLVVEWAVLQARPVADQRRKLALTRMLELYRRTGRDQDAAKLLERVKRDG